MKDTKDKASIIDKVLQELEASSKGVKFSIKDILDQSTRIKEMEDRIKKSMLKSGSSYTKF